MRMISANRQIKTSPATSEVMITPGPAKKLTPLCSGAGKIPPAPESQPGRDAASEVLTRILTDDAETPDAAPAAITNDPSVLLPLTPQNVEMFASMAARAVSDVAFDTPMENVT